MQYSCNFQKVYQTDVLVVGGGTAGFGAAVAAARNGAKTMLIEQTSVLGGMATSGLVGPFMTCYDSKGENMIIRGIFEEIVNRMVEKGFAIHPSEVRQGTGFTSWIKIGHEHVTPYEPEGLKVIIDEMLTEAGVKVLYHTDFLRPVLAGETITGVLVSSKRGIERIDGKIVIETLVPSQVTAELSAIDCQNLLNKSDIIALYGSNQHSAEAMVTANENLQVLGTGAEDVIGAGFDSGAVIKE